MMSREHPFFIVFFLEKRGVMEEGRSRKGEREERVVVGGHEREKIRRGEVVER